MNTMMPMIAKKTSSMACHTTQSVRKEGGIMTSGMVQVVHNADHNGI